MIHSKKIRIVTMILICIMLLNFIVEPKQVESAGMTLAAEFGLPIAKELIQFILLSAAAGVTYLSAKEANVTRVKFKQYVEQQEPDEPPPNYKDVLKQMWRVGSAGTIVMSAINHIKNFFQSLGAKEGENIYNEESIIISEFTQLYMKASDRKNIIINNNGKYGLLTLYGKLSENQSSWRIHGNLNGVEKIINANLTNPNNQRLINIILATNKITVQIYGTSYMVDWSNLNDFGDEPISIPDNIYYFVDNNSYVITNNPPSTLPQPNINPDLLPQDKLKTVIKPDGSIVQQYEGDLDDLTDDIAENATFENLISPGEYKVYEIDEETGAIIEIVPEGDPLPFPEVESPELPASELAGLGSLISLGKSIVNWLYNLWLYPQNLVKSLFEVPESLSLDTSKLRLNNFNTKFPFSIPWDLHRALTVFAKQPSTPNIGIDINTENLKVNHNIDLSRIDLPLRFARYVATIFFIIYLANKTRDLIKW